MVIPTMDVDYQLVVEDGVMICYNPWTCSRFPCRFYESALSKAHSRANKDHDVTGIARICNMCEVMYCGKATI